jgi:molybdopterin converting factor subunit 1
MTSSTQARIKLFALARDLAGTDTLALDLPAGCTVAMLRAMLVDRAPALAPVLPRSAIAINLEYARDDTRINPTDEIAIIPPVSGG